MKRNLLLLAAAAVIAFSSGCSSASGLSAEIAAQQSAGPSARSRRTVIDTEADLPELPTFSFAPIEVATPRPVFADAVSATKAPSIAETAEPVASEGTVPAEDTPDNVPSASPGHLYAGRTIAVRWVDLSGGRIMETVYAVPDGASSEDLMKFVTKGLRAALADQKIQIVSASWKDGYVTVDFAPGIYLLELSSGDEAQVLESIADSYLRNVDGIKGVIFTAEGKPYHSEHIEMNEGEPYKELRTDA